MKKIIYKDGRGTRCTGWAQLDTDSEYVWVFDNKNDKYGGTIHRSQIVKIF